MIEQETKTDLDTPEETNGEDVCEEQHDGDVEDTSEATLPARDGQRPGVRIDEVANPQFVVDRRLAVVLTPKAFTQLYGYAGATEREVSLLGIVERDGPVFKITEFFLVEQSGSPGHTETDPTAVAELMEKLIAEGRAEDAGKLRCWAHSHPSMGLFWSGTDEANCRQLVSDWLVSIVVHQGYGALCRLDAAVPVPFVIDHVPIYFESPLDDETAEHFAEEVREKVKYRSLFGYRRTTKDKEEDDMDEYGMDVVEYCDLCGGWHAAGDCPMEQESSAFEMARDERLAERECDPFGDDYWF